MLAVHDGKDVGQGTNLAACIDNRQVATVAALSHQWLAETLSAEGLLAFPMTTLMSMCLNLFSPSFSI